MQESPRERPDLRHSIDELQHVDRVRSRLEALSHLDAAEVICLDSDLQIFHRFKELRVFVILRLQRRLVAMTEELDNLKKRASDGYMEAISNDSTLDSLTKNIEGTLKDYDAALLAHAKVVRFSSPRTKFLPGFIQFCATKLPILAHDLGVDGPRKRVADALAAIALEEKSWTHRLIDQNEFLQKYLATTTEHKTGRIVVETYSESNIRRAELVFVNVTFSLMLFCPIIALSWVENAAGKLAIVLGFLLLGAVLMSGILTTANNASLAVLAGYGAILVFFLGVKADLSC